MENRPEQDPKIAHCLIETYKHVKLVAANINLFVRALIDRAENHDNSKFEEPELSGFAAGAALGEIEYGSEAYKKTLEALKPTILHHYSKNRHHSEHWPNGIADMNLVDLIEMLADWKSATERNLNGNIRKSIEVNAEKYGISPQLKRILENTVKDFFQSDR